MIATFAPVTTLVRRLRAVLWLGLALATGPLYAQATIAVTSDSLEFPAIAIGDTTIDSLYVINTNTVENLTVDTLSLIHGTVFTIDTTYSIIIPEDSLKVHITYTPSAFGSDVDSLLIISNAANAETLYVYLSGSSPLPTIAASRDSVIFPAIAVDTSKVDSLFIRNTDTLNVLTVDTLSLVHGTVFALDTTGGEIPAGDSLKVRVTYSPSAFGTDVDSLLII
ncbi:MAG: choice-of-anchor D domain-containing protein, partial [Fidelibacterota bacterium]